MEHHPFLEAESGGRHALVFHPDHIDDAALWRAFREGDEKALISIFNRFSNILFNYGFKFLHDRETVKDAIQELFIELWKNKENLGETNSIKFYLFKSLRRKLARIKNKTEKKMIVQLSSQHDEAFPSHEFVLISEQLTEERRRKVKQMLDTLTERQREAIFLRYFEEQSYDRIALIMDLGKQAVYNLINKAIRELRRAGMGDGSKSP